jgi:hypothetical protein
MTEISYFWGGTSVGDHGAYTDDAFSDFICSLFQRDRTTEGVVFGQLNELAVTNSSGVVIRTNTGYALVDGKLYHSSANVDHNIAAPGGGYNYYRVVLRKDFATQTVRNVLIGPSTVTYPTVTQTDGTTWEISIASVRISSASAITITDERAFIHPAVKVSSAMIDLMAITGALIATGTITVDKLATTSFPGSRCIFPDLPALSPFSGVASAAGEIIESSGAGTAKLLIPEYRFADSVDQGIVIPTRISSDFYGTLKVRIGYYMAGANSSKTVAWNVQIGAISDGDSGVTAKVLAATNQLVVTVPDTAGYKQVCEITINNADSIVARDWVCFFIWRDISNGTAAGDAVITDISYEWS